MTLYSQNECGTRMNTIIDTIERVDRFQYTETSTVELEEHVHTIEVIDISEFVDLVFYEDDFEGVLLTCRGKFKPRRKSLKKQTSEESDEENNSKANKKGDKNQHSNFLKKRRLHSDAKKDDEMGLLISKFNKQSDEASNKQSPPADEKKSIQSPSDEKHDCQNVDKKPKRKTSVAKKYIDNVEKTLSVSESSVKTKTPAIQMKIIVENKQIFEKYNDGSEVEKTTISEITEPETIEDYDIVQSIEINELENLASKLSENIPTSEIYSDNSDPEISKLKLYVLNDYADDFTDRLLQTSLDEAKGTFNENLHQNFKTNSFNNHNDNENKISDNENMKDIGVLGKNVLNTALTDKKVYGKRKIGDVDKLGFYADNVVGNIMKCDLNLEASNHKDNEIMRTKIADLSDSISVDVLKTSYIDMKDLGEKSINLKIEKDKLDSPDGEKLTNGTHKVKSDRELSGYAEKLAELLADEDDLEFIESDEDEEEKKKKNKQSKVTKRKKKRGRARGDRPQSLYAQDMLNDVNKVVDEHIANDEKEESEDDESVEEDEFLPVADTVKVLQNSILLPREDSISSYEIAYDEIMRQKQSITVHIPLGDKPVTLRKAAVIDTGCGILKAGICGQTTPSCYCPSVIGVPRRFSQDVSKMKKAYYVGDEAWEKAGMLQINHPIKQDISNWSDVTNMLEYLMEAELNVNNREHPIMMTEMGSTSRRQREKITEIMFEQFQVPSFYLANQSVLAMYSMGLTSGVCLNSGYFSTRATPVYDGHALPHAIQQLNIGGEQVTSYLGRLLQSSQNTSFITSSEKLVLNSIKQSLCYVSSDAKAEGDKYTKNNYDMYSKYTLPDGQEIELGTERFIAPEVLFDPQMLGLKEPNAPELVQYSIEATDGDLHELLKSNVLTTGGNSKLLGFNARCVNELHDIDHSVKAKASDNPLLATWVGGSIISSIEGFRNQWITFDQYTEYGSPLVHKLCF